MVPLTFVKARQLFSKGFSAQEVPQKKSWLQKITQSLCIPRSVGLETVGGVMTKLINGNTVTPTQKSQVPGFGTVCCCCCCCLAF